jgi:hypothetical protein
MASPSPPLGAERVGVRWGIPGRRPPTSPSHACGVGPFLSPLKGGEGFLTGPDVCMPQRESGGPEPVPGLNRGQPLRPCRPGFPLSRE